MRKSILRVFVSPWFSRLFSGSRPSFFLLVFFFLPLSKILILAFNTSALTKPNFQLILSTLASFTFYQATLSTILTFVSRSAVCSPFFPFQLSRQILASRANRRSLYASHSCRRIKFQCTIRQSRLIFFHSIFHPFTHFSLFTHLLPTFSTTQPSSSAS